MRKFIIFFFILIIFPSLSWSAVDMAIDLDLDGSLSFLDRYDKIYIDDSISGITADVKIYVDSFCSNNPTKYFAIEDNRVFADYTVRFVDSRYGADYTACLSIGPRSTLNDDFDVLQSIDFNCLSCSDKCSLNPLFNSPVYWDNIIKTVEITKLENELGYDLFLLLEQNKWGCYID